MRRPVVFRRVGAAGVSVVSVFDLRFIWGTVSSYSSKVNQAPPGGCYVNNVEPIKKKKKV